MTGIDSEEDPEEAVSEVAPEVSALTATLESPWGVVSFVTSVSWIYRQFAPNLQLPHLKKRHLATEEEADSLSVDPVCPALVCAWW